MSICLNIQHLWFFFCNSLIGEPCVINSLGQRFYEWDWMNGFSLSYFLTNDRWYNINTHSLKRCNRKRLPLKVDTRPSANEETDLGCSHPFNEQGNKLTPLFSVNWRGLRCLFKLNVKSVCKVMLSTGWWWFPPVSFPTHSLTGQFHPHLSILRRDVPNRRWCLHVVQGERLELSEPQKCFSLASKQSNCFTIIYYYSLLY